MKRSGKGPFLLILVSLLFLRGCGKKEEQPESPDIRFSLERAVYKKELLGNILAVHEANMINEGSILLVASIRPTGETLLKYGKINASEADGRNHYGDFQLRECSEPGKNVWYSNLAIANIWHRGINIKWVLMINTDRPDDDHTLELSSYIHTRNELQRDLQKRGLPWYEKYKDLGEVRFVETGIGMKEVLAKLHRDCRFYESEVDHIQVFEGFRKISETGLDGEYLTGSLSYLKPGKVKEKRFIEKVREYATQTKASAR